MNSDKEQPLEQGIFQPLSKREIDRRIECVMNEVAAADSLVAEHSSPSGESLRPRWISPRELVERMRRFIVYN